MAHPESDDERGAADATARPSAFDEIVASWVAEGSVPRWPDGDVPDLSDVSDASEAPITPSTAPAPTPPPAPAQKAVPPPAPSPPAAPPRAAAPDEHFVPPDPPPLPHLGPRAIVGLGLLVVGVILAATPQVVDLTEPAGLALGLLSLALGLGWLVLGSWPSHDDPEEDDDGAIL